MKKQYVAIVIDNSGSMFHITHAAMNDYNNSVQTLKSMQSLHRIPTLLSVVNCGIKDGTWAGQATVKRMIVNSPVDYVNPLVSYAANGENTPLFDSVGEAISILESVPDVNDPDVSFLVTIITDGYDNASKKWDGRSIANKINTLQKTGRWTVTFRVPRGKNKFYLSDLGISAGNILEWDTTEEGMNESAKVQTLAYDNQYNNVSRGIKSSKTFYTDVASVSKTTIKKELNDVTRKVDLMTVPQKDDGIQIRDFIESEGLKYVRGRAYYQLVKKEKALQDYKKLCIRDVKSGKIYEGEEAARDLLNLPHTGSVRIAPGDHGGYEIFVQSTSVNRKLPAGSKVLYWNR